MSPEDYLFDWAQNYIRHKDSLRKKIISMERQGNKIVVRQKDKTLLYVPAISLDAVEKADEGSIFVTFNTHDNFTMLLQKWASMVQKKLTAIFINPLSKLDDKWIVQTNVHEIICDKSSFKIGLKTMFECVELLDSSKIEQLVKGVQ